MDDDCEENELYPAYKRGCRDYELGLSTADCPYPKFNESGHVDEATIGQRGAWRNGWQDAAHEARRRHKFAHP